jgi:hypothetical protein
MDPADRDAFLEHIPGRIATLNHAFHDMGLNVRELFTAVGADYDALCRSVMQRKDEVIREVAGPLAA